MLQVFETVGAAELTPEHYDEFVLPYLRQIGTRVKARLAAGNADGGAGGADVPLIVFSKDTHRFLSALGESDFDVVGLDWKVDRAEARASFRVGAAAKQQSDSETGADALEKAKAGSAAAAPPPAGAAAREAVDKCVQGNLDPAALFGSTEVIRREVARMLEEFGTQNLIANLGHGLSPTHDPARVADFVHAVHDISEEINWLKQQGGE